MKVETVSLGDIATIVAGQSPPGNTCNEAGMGLPFFQGKADFGETSPVARKWCTNPKKIADHGDILISVRAPVGPTNIASERCCIGRGLAAIRPDGDVALRDFVHWAIVSRTDELVRKAQGSTFEAIGQNDLKSLPVPLPPLAEQRHIASILNRETARLDALVTAKERMLELLAEKRRALITCAVTRGTGRGKLFRDSGIPWLGEIPLHWKIVRAKRLFKERDERSETGKEDLLTVSHITGVTLRADKNVNMFEAATTEGYKICQPGDLVVNTLWAWMGAMGVSPKCGIVSPAYNVYVPKAILDPGYVDAIVRLPVFAQEVTRYSKGVWSSRLRLYPEGLYEISFPVPPLDEQREIAAYIADEAGKLDALMAEISVMITLLKERRAAIIAAAVEGLIDMERAA